MMVGMTTPDQSDVFEADAARLSEAELRARLAEMEAQKKPVEVIDEAGAPVDGSKGHRLQTVTVAGHEFRFRVPSEGALLAFSLGASDNRDAEMTLSTMRMLLRFHLEREDYEVLVSGMLDPESPMGEDTMGDIITAMVDAAANSNEARAPKHGPR